MPRLFQQTVPVEAEEVSYLINQNWSLVIGNKIKASQNHTFIATDQNNNKYAVRVTPDPLGVHLQRVTDELDFVKFIFERASQVCPKEHICAPIPSLTNKALLERHNDLLLSVSEWAKGKSLIEPFGTLQWMLERPIIFAVGKFMGELHKLSRAFSHTNPAVSVRIQRWDQVHDNLMKGTVVHADDLSVVDDPTQFGIIHGDMNVSNYYYDADTESVSVFDWDQSQRCWFEYDLAQAIFGVYMLQHAGMPFNGAPVPSADSKAFQSILLEGYESVSDQPVNKARLERMMLLKTEFYRRFCSRAMDEGDVPADMAPFVAYVVNWLGK